MGSQMKFKIKRFYENDVQIDSLPLTPLLDIIFLVTIFFVLTSGAIFQQMIEVELPNSSTADTSLDKNWTISVISANRVYLNSKETTLNELDQLIKSELKNFDSKMIEVSLAANRLLPYDIIIRVFDVIRLNGIVRISLLTTDQGQ
jgi:biopolymer transport protein ExbD